MNKLREIGIGYQNMKLATYEVALHLGMDVTDPQLSRADVAHRLSGKSLNSCELLTKHGSMAAVKRARKKERRKTEKPKYLPGIPSASTLERDIKSFYESWEWKTLSYNVKLNRGRRCECCGAAPPEVRIVTDHIKPLRHFWHLRLQEDNLQVLCDDCNMGKGSRDQTDFRAETKVQWGDTWDDIPLKGYPN